MSSVQSHAPARAARPAAASTASAPTSRLRVGLIGGPTRSGPQLEKAAAALGCDLEHHDGMTKGRRTVALEAMVRRVDVLVILTDVNSHNAVVQARRVAVACGKPHVMSRRLGVSQLVSLLATLRAGDSAADGGLAGHRTRRAADAAGDSAADGGLAGHRTRRAADAAGDRAAPEPSASEANPVRIGAARRLRRRKPINRGYEPERFTASAQAGGA